MDPGFSNFIKYILVISLPMHMPFSNFKINTFFSWDPPATPIIFLYLAIRIISQF